MQEQNLNNLNNPLDVISRIALLTNRHNLQRLTPLHRQNIPAKIILRLRLSTAHKLHRPAERIERQADPHPEIKIQCQDCQPA